MIHSFDIAIVGAGPAGATTAIALSESNLRVALIDKSTFPRDKICGDALSPDIYKQLTTLPGSIAKEFLEMAEKLPLSGFKIIAPNHAEAAFKLQDDNLKMFVSKREDFDNLLFSSAAAKKNVTVFTGVAAKTIETKEDGVRVILKNGEEINATMVLGADGAHSIVASQLGGIKLDRNHHSGGLRVYYENVSGLDDSIELHFIEEVLPGYLWIFPLKDNRANVGLGMLSSHISENNVNLKQVLKEAIDNHPNLSKRFENATALESYKGMGLPMGSRHMKRSGDRFLLLGDAGYLIDPLTGEGIGNAIRSGRVAAEHVLKAFEANRFDADFNLRYDREIKRRMQGELNFSHRIAGWFSNPKLANFIVKHVLNRVGVQQMVNTGLNPRTIRKLLAKPSFYVTFFKRAYSAHTPS